MAVGVSSSLFNSGQESSRAANALPVAKMPQPVFKTNWLLSICNGRKSVWAVTR